MKRFANGSQPTGEYQSRAEYDAGYRDGYRTASERCANETAVLRHRLDALVQSITAVSQFSPVPAIVVTAEEAKRLNLGASDES